jgi:hypothetical protein
MFVPGDVVLAPWRGDEGKIVPGNHYLVVLGEVPGVGVVAMYTTSLKQRSGGIYEFTRQEMEQADFRRPCRFDPSRVAIYGPEHRELITPTVGRLSRKAVKRILEAVRKARPPKRYF